MSSHLFALSVSWEAVKNMWNKNIKNSPANCMGENHQAGKITAYFFWSYMPKWIASVILITNPFVRTTIYIHNICASILDTSYVQPNAHVYWNILQENCFLQ